MFLPGYNSASDGGDGDTIEGTPHEVYIGEMPSELERVATLQGGSNVAVPPQLRPLTRYWWRVDVPSGARGEVWQFETAPVVQRATTSATLQSGD